METWEVDHDQVPGPKGIDPPRHGCPACGEFTKQINLGRDRWYCCDAHKVAWRDPVRRGFGDDDHETVPNWDEGESSLVGYYDATCLHQTWDETSWEEWEEDEQFAPLDPPTITSELLAEAKRKWAADRIAWDLQRAETILDRMIAGFWELIPEETRQRAIDACIILRRLLPDHDPGSETLFLRIISTGWTKIE